MMSRNQNIKTFGRGKHSNHPNTVVHTSIQFDKLFCDSTNGPTAAKSAGTVGKWGVTSFTSIRSSTFSVGRKESRFSSLGKKKLQQDADDAVQSKRSSLSIRSDANKDANQPRKFFKSRNAESSNSEKRSNNLYGSMNNSYSAVRRTYRNLRSEMENTLNKSAITSDTNDRSGYGEKINKEEKIQQPAAAVPSVIEYEKPIKLSISKKACLSVVQNNNNDCWKQEENPVTINTSQNLSPINDNKERDKPPIVLRIFKGTSQLVTDSSAKSVSPKTDDNSRSPIFSVPVIKTEPEAMDTKNVIDYDTLLSCKEEVKSEPVSPASVDKEVNLKDDDEEEDEEEEEEEEDRVENDIGISLAGNSRGTLSPVITTRNLRRRPAPVKPASTTAASVEASDPPSKRVLRSRRNSASSCPPPSSTATGKLVIKNLNSAHPTVYTLSVSESVTAPVDAPAMTATHHSKKENKSNKVHNHRVHKLKINLKNNVVRQEYNDQESEEDAEANSEQRAVDEVVQNQGAMNQTVTEQNDDEKDAANTLKRVEDLLAGSCVDGVGESPSCTSSAIFSNVPKKPDTAELLRVLEDDAADEYDLLTTDNKTTSNVTDNKAPIKSSVPVVVEKKVPEIPKLKLTLKKNSNKYISAAILSVPSDSATTATPAAEFTLTKVPEKIDNSVTDTVVNVPEKIADVLDTSAKESSEMLTESLESQPPAVITEESDLPVKKPVPSTDFVIDDFNNDNRDWNQVSESVNAVVDQFVELDDKLPDDEPIKPSLSPVQVDSGVYEASSLTGSSSQEIDAKDEEDIYEEDSTLATVKEDNTNSVPNVTTVSYPLLKKGSIFKARNAAGGNKNRLALYKHKWTTDDRDSCSINREDNDSTLEGKKESSNSVFDIDDYDEEAPLTKITKPITDKFGCDDVVTSIKCSRKNKEYYTVIKNVKNAHQIQESGEFQEFNDDVEYILDALQDNNPIGTRCLSAITLATKCMEPAFRMHVRAHGTVTKFFKTLHDATKDQSLGMCTATVMFVLSQDRLNMDLDRSSLELMLSLLESDASHRNALDDCGLTDSQLTKTRDRVRQICADIQAQGHAKHLNLDNITVGHLAMETLLSLTSKRAGEWFKEELRDLGGLEHIIKTIVECCRHVDDTANAWSSASLDKIRKVDRCLRVLENVTTDNEQNNVYMLEYQEGILTDTLIRMYKVCDYEIPLYPTYNITDKECTGAVLRECLIANLKVLINITQTYSEKSYGAYKIGSKPGMIDSSLHVLLQLPQHIPDEERFDLILLTLILLINLVEHCDHNRKLIIEAKAPSDDESIFETKSKEAAVKALIRMFYHYEQLARTEEKKTDAILEGEGTNGKPQHEEFVEETVAMLLQKAGQHMEHTLISAYVAVLIGHIVSGNDEYNAFVRQHLPEKNFGTMITVLQKFFNFMTLTASGGTGSTRGIKSTQMVIQKLIESDQKASLSSSSAATTSAVANDDYDDDFGDRNNSTFNISSGDIGSQSNRDSVLDDSCRSVIVSSASSVTSAPTRLNSVIVSNTC